MRRSQSRKANNGMYKFLIRDVPSVSFEKKLSQNGRWKVFLIDKELNHREVCYMKEGANFVEAMNELAISYIIKFNEFYDVLRLACPRQGRVD